jgi:hypothetical protein
MLNPLQWWWEKTSVCDWVLGLVLGSVLKWAQQSVLLWEQESVQKRVP